MMPRPFRVIEGFDAMVEDFGYSIGDAEDWVNRNQADFSEWAEMVAMGEMSVGDMKRRMNERFANAARQINEARELLSADAQRAGFKHLHPSLLELSIPAARVVVPLPFSGETA